MIELLVSFKQNLTGTDIYGGSSDIIIYQADKFYPVESFRQYYPLQEMRQPVIRVCNSEDNNTYWVEPYYIKEVKVNELSIE